MFLETQLIDTHKQKNGKKQIFVQQISIQVKLMFLPHFKYTMTPIDANNKRMIKIKMILFVTTLAVIPQSTLLALSTFSLT